MSVYTFYLRKEIMWKVQLRERDGFSIGFKEK